MDRRSVPGVSAAPWIRPASAAADRRARQRRSGRSGAARLRPHAHRAVRRALPRAGPRVGLGEGRAIPDPELRSAAGEARQLPSRGRLRWRRLRVAIAVRDALGLVRVAPLWQAGHLVRNLDVAAFPGVPRDAARSQGRGRPALPLRHQPADRPRLAVLAAGGRLARLDVLRRRRLLGQEPVVAGDAGHVAVSAARQLRAPPGGTGRGRRALRADRRRVGDDQAGERPQSESLEQHPRSRRPGGPGDSGRRTHVRSDRRRHLGRSAGAAVPADRGAGGRLTCRMRRAAGSQSTPPAAGRSSRPDATRICSSGSRTCCRPMSRSILRSRPSDSSIVVWWTRTCISWRTRATCRRSCARASAIGPHTSSSGIL